MSTGVIMGKHVGTTTVSRVRRRYALLLSASIGTLALAGGSAEAQSVSPASCTTSGTTVTCSGDLSGGVDIDGGSGTFTTLNVNDLSTNIAPPADTSGIRFVNDGPVNIDVEAGPFTVETSGNGHGIAAQSDTDGDVFVETDADITSAGGDAIMLDSEGGTLTVRNTGVLTAADAAISAGTDEGGSIDIRSIGDLTVTDLRGDAAIDVRIIGIPGSGHDDQVVINSNGKLIGGDEGISSFIAGDGDTIITSVGDITAGEQGIQAQTNGVGDITIDSEGEILSLDDQGILADLRQSGDVKLTSVGRVEARGRFDAALDARVGSGTHTGSIVLSSTGDLSTTGEEGEGITATLEGSGDITVDSEGDIFTSGAGSSVERSSAGLFAHRTQSEGFQGSGDITIGSTGAITTRGNFSAGIAALIDGDPGAISVTTNGAILTEGLEAHGIHARNTGNGSVSIDVTGSVATTSGLSRGIRAETSSGEIDITLNGVSVLSSLSEGILFEGGSGNTLTTFGSTSVSGGTFDILGTTGDETINNFGTLSLMGATELGAGNNAFNNFVGATLETGNRLNLGLGNNLSNDGTLSPGGTGSVQVTALDGNFSNSADGTFVVTIDEDVNARNDRLNVSGAASLDGGMVQVDVVRAPDRATYTILTADQGVRGTFDDVTDTLFIDYALSYDSNNVFLTASVRASRFCDLAGSGNGAAVACDAIDGLPDDNEIVQALLELETQEDAQKAFEALSGEVYASVSSALLQNGQSVVRAVNNRLHDTSADGNTATSTAAFGRLAPGGDNGFWITGYGSWSDTDATASTAQMDNDLGGVVVGLDREVHKDWRVGVLGGYGRSDIIQGALSSSANADSWSIGLYGGAEKGATRFSFGGLYSWHSIDSSRTAGFPGFGQTLTASYDAQSWQLFAEAGHQIELRHVTLEPFAGISYMQLDTDGFTETGGIAALTVASATNSTTFTTLGVRSSLQLAERVRTHGMLGWRHAFGDTSPSAAFTLAGSSPFTVEGAPIAENALVTEFGLEASLTDNAELGLSYVGQYGDGTTAHGLNASFLVKF